MLDCVNLHFDNISDLFYIGEVKMCDIKVNSVQETRAKCLAVQILKFEILQIT